jgi:hypothetical protein
MDVRLPDGTVIKDVPDGTTKADLATKLKANGMAVPSEWLEAPKPQAAQTAGAAIMDIPRQVGMTARYGLEGLGRLADIPVSPFRAAINMGMVAAGQKPLGTVGQAAENLANMAGLPAPQTPNERTIGEAARTMAGGGGMMGLARLSAGATSGVAQNALQRMAAGPGVQTAGAAGAGLAGGAVKEAGGNELAQFGASLLGGIGGGMGADAGRRAATAAVNALTPKTVQLQAADQQIRLILERTGGVDWNQVPERIRQGMREEAAAAMTNGQPLNADALRRMMAFKQTGTTPTVGMLTQNPAQITAERNLAKTGANSTDRNLQRLPQLENDNVRQLLRNLDEAGAARGPEAINAGRSVVEALDSNVARSKGEINSLYNAARDSSGRSLPLEGGTFSARANQMLDEQNVGSFLPPDIVKKMNAIARGEYPLTVDVAEQLKTSIGNMQRGSPDGNVRRALGIVRQALDEAPLQGSQRVNPGNLPAVPGTMPPSVQAGQQSIDAFNAARSANRQFMQRVESNPALKAVVDGVEPDQFVSKFVIGKGASAADVQNLRNEISPQAAQQLKDHLVRYLRDAATNNTDDIAKFSNDAYRRALRDIGQDKLSVFFNAEELRQLRAVGDAAKYMQAQPAGSAVNNSNSGALMLGRGLDMLESVSSKIPFGVRDVIQGTLQGAQQTRVLSPRNALMTPPPANELGVRMNPLLAATVVTPAEARKNDRRN